MTEVTEQQTPSPEDIWREFALGMRDFTGLLTLIGSDAVDNSIGRIAIDPVSFIMSIISSFGLIGLTRNLLKQTIGLYTSKALGFDTRGLASTYKNPFNNEFYHLRGVIQARELTKDGELYNLPGSVRTYFLCLRGVRAWKDKVINYADIKPTIIIIYWKLGCLAVVTAIFSLLRLLAVIRIVDSIGFTAIISYINAVLLALFGFTVWFQYINTIFNGEDKTSLIWLVTTTRDSYNRERSMHYTVLIGFKPTNREEEANKPWLLVRILAGIAMVTSVISYVAILSSLQGKSSVYIAIWLAVECILCLLRMIVWATPKVKALLSPSSDSPIQHINSSDEKVWERKSWFTTAPVKQWSLFSGMPSGSDIDAKLHTTLCPDEKGKSIWMNSTLLKLMQAGLVNDIGIGSNDVSLILMSSPTGRCKFIKKYNLDTVEKDILEECTSQLLVMNNIGLEKFGIPKWALGHGITAVGRRFNHYGHKEIWIVVQCPEEPYEVMQRSTRPTRKIDRTGYSIINETRFKVHVKATASSEGISVDEIGEPQPIDKFNLPSFNIKVEMSDQPKYADMVYD
ncbi:hypothetical protein RhiirA1_464126 [Rhizophagus irregularis]|uniref:Uncharacterized protein n=1 Tax=Rhizophagus irregularis TaxID=588596 RepID=A0A2I1E116_9GLOM|nr:hypothetical protein RhiirA1_464126 [Rhizophagus irregularis]PKY15807.1 hypothetical protein RhiirB3_381236 [Rhizophagus irregularis]CAB4473629.1 unnamed protein product [Rhizophagus irregularis]CAB5145402.1 unnamed protein product [Rhizophagus irregularis]CAB5365372.1 unnamed protein product [Rhizophagus irregularis]